MTREEVEKMIAEIGERLNADYSYKSFPRDYKLQPPYICYYYESSDDMYADNSNYVNIRPIMIEIYTQFCDFDAYQIVEEVLEEYNMAWSEYDVDIPDELLYEKIYETEVILNG